jgi:hypothetical protein
MKSRKLFATAAVAAVSLVSASSWGFSFKDIKYWVGSGTNECAVVIDFNDGSVMNSSFAWGYRWNGDAPSFKTILDEIAADDPRLASFVSDSGWVSGFGYDVDDDGGTFHTGKTYTKSDKDDLFPQPKYEYDDSEYDDDEIEEPNMYMVGDDWAAAYATGKTFEDLEWRRTDAVTTGVFPVNGQWLAQRFAAYSMEMTGWSYIIDEFAPEKTPAAATRTFRLDDITLWAGAGEKRSGIAISWGDGKTRAWGIRWDGDEAPTVKEAIEAIAAADGRLVPHITSESWGFNLDTFGYDAADVGGVTYNWKAYSASDPSAWIAPYSVDYVNPDDWNTWVYHYFNLVTEPDNFFRTGAAAYTWASVGIGEQRLADGAWTILAYNEGDYLSTLDGSIAAAAPSAHAAPTESPYGAEVVECSTGATHPWFKNPENVLGEPARFVPLYSGSMGGVSSDVYGGVANPVVPAYAKGLHLSLVSPDDEEPGFVTIAFDHDVVDDPENPFGVDFIVFGNSGCTKTSLTGMTALDDPAQCRLTGGGFPEESVIEVAQSKDGPWYTSSKWRTGDGFAPTLGHRYDPANADASLYDGNRWWGAKTDATFPVDPRIDFSDCAGLTLAELCQRYNGSAGGAGYDLADVEGLPVDAKGRKWFRYVKISCAYSEEPNDDGDFGFTEPEIDAVADVAPASGYELWRERSYTDWATAWKATPDALAANGLPNGLNYLYGVGPVDAVPANVQFKLELFAPGKTEHVFGIRSPAQFTGTPKGLVVKKADTLGAEWTSAVPTFVSSERQADGTWLNTFSLPASVEGRFFKLALELE